MTGSHSFISEFSHLVCIPVNLYSGVYPLEYCFPMPMLDQFLQASAMSAFFYNNISPDLDYMVYLCCRPKTSSSKSKTILWADWATRALLNRVYMVFQISLVHLAVPDTQIHIYKTK